MAVAGLILGYIGFILSIGVFIIKKMVEADIRDSFMK
jgi:Flp pilus assembly protein TadB